MESCLTNCIISHNQITHNTRSPSRDSFQMDRSNLRHDAPLPKAGNIPSPFLHPTMRVRASQEFCAGVLLIVRGETIHRNKYIQSRTTAPDTVHTNFSMCLEWTVCWRHYPK